MTITGIETESYFDVIALQEKIVAGRLERRAARRRHRHRAREGSRRATSATSCGSRRQDKAASTFNVIGIFDFGNKGINARNVYVALRSAQSLLDLAGGASSLEVKVRDPFAAETVAQAIRAGADLKVDSWIRTNAQFFTAMAAQILANTLIRVFVGITVALGIASVLVVSVVQKSKEVGILRAMGTGAPRSCACS